MAFDVKTNSFKNVDDIAIYKYAKYFDAVSGSYGISSTAQDLFKWNQAIQNNILLKQNNFLRAISADRLNNRKLIQKGDRYYGFGWVFKDSTDNKDKMHFHDGEYSGYKNIIVREFAHQKCIIVLMNKWNTIDILPLTFAIDAILKKRKTPAIEREKLTGAITLVESQVKQLLGTYEYTKQPDLKFKITAGDSGNLFAQLSGQAAIEVYPKNNLELFYTTVQAVLKFSKENDEVSTLTLYQNGRELTFNKVK
jgi:hypothetical protein